MISDGGLAFGTHRFVVSSSGEVRSECDGGMSLRDWFAGQALSRALHDGIFTDSVGMTFVAAAAYEMADAMLLARAQKPTEQP